MINTTFISRQAAVPRLACCLIKKVSSGYHTVFIYQACTAHRSRVSRSELLLIFAVKQILEMHFILGKRTALCVFRLLCIGVSQIYTSSRTETHSCRTSTEASVFVSSERYD